jgi:UDP-N-acetylmuramoyl-L-alanyl-D-glutamate--2,6-diaminopimelate ligase
LKQLAAETLSYGVEGGADIVAENVDVQLSGLRFRARTPKGAIDVRSPLSGEFNVGNLLAAIGAAISLNVDLPAIEQALEHCSAAPGRFERIDGAQPFVVIVDYAHTDDALRNLIEAARGLLERTKRPGRVITVFGCGGDRDRTKRPAMGEIAGRLSDSVILTSDNPRSENPLNIINDILVGLRRVDVSYQVEPDRAAAIRLALTDAHEGDIVLLAGKGHETYQTIGERTIPFDDRETARSVLKELGYGVSSAVQ